MVTTGSPEPNTSADPSTTDGLQVSSRRYVEAGRLPHTHMRRKRNHPGWKGLAATRVCSLVVVYLEK